MTRKSLRVHSSPIDTTDEADWQKHCESNRLYLSSQHHGCFTFVLIVLHGSVGLFAWNNTDTEDQRVAPRQNPRKKRNIKRDRRGRARKVSSHLHTLGQDTERHCRCCSCQRGSTHSLRTEGWRDGEAGSRTIGDCAVTCVGGDDRLCIVFCLRACGREGLGWWWWWWWCARGFSEKRAKETRGRRNKKKTTNAKSECLWNVRVEVITRRKNSIEWNRVSAGDTDQGKPALQQEKLVPAFVELSDLTNPGSGSKYGPKLKRQH